MVFAVTGGGSGAISTLLETPGASASVLAAVVPYAPSALREWLGGTPDQACSERTARAMAMAGFQRARALSQGDPRSLRGIGTTASLATNRPKLGPHRVHVAWQSAEVTAVASLELTKDVRSRAEEEAIAAELTLVATADACGVSSNDSSLASLLPTESVSWRRAAAPARWTQLLLGEVAGIVCRHPEQPAESWNDVALLPPAHRPAALLCGAFNPVHDGHRRMAEIAAKRLGVPVTWELSIANVDKPPLDFLEIQDRLAELPRMPVMLTCAATFEEKATFVPGCTFIIGADTLERVVAPRYYGNNIERRDASIDALAKRGCRFLVFGRTGANGFRGLENFDLPAPLAALCEEVPESEFRMDVASSRLRAGQ
jgi:nicotinamide mononucleotide (NMN) deamidase PncC